MVQCSSAVLVVKTCWATVMALIPLGQRDCCTDR